MATATSRHYHRVYSDDIRGSKCEHYVATDTDDFDTESTEVTSTGVAYQRRLAASFMTDNSVLQCSMQFEEAVQPTATPPELNYSTVPPTYKFTWDSKPILIVGEYHHLHNAVVRLHSVAQKLNHLPNYHWILLKLSSRLYVFRPIWR